LHHIDTSDEEELPANASPEEIERARITRQVKKIAELAASTRN
jgi:signal transduction histidine kinase